jgi:hypothetical protein
MLGAECREQNVGTAASAVPPSKARRQTTDLALSESPNCKRVEQAFKACVKSL